MGVEMCLIVSTYSYIYMYIPGKPLAVITFTSDTLYLPIHEDGTGQSGVAKTSRYTVIIIKGNE
jgi:hypothetical protein